ncbi:RNA binding motif protein 22 [Chytridiales sp. JEL 0842]|nr:RNA binding motif protein 22 [Chytridiales sp. JEL 0842]
MTRQTQGKECKICARPFTVFKWSPGSGMRYKKTEICQTCSKIKNVCQTCVLDLEYGLPVQVRDSVLNVQDVAPRSDVNREYFIQNVEGQLGATDTLVNYGKADSVAKEALRKMARTEPYYKRNRPHICSFFAKGECKRGDECPFRHERPEENDLSHQNIKDRFFGHNDPVANKILSRASKPPPPKPGDENSKSLFLTGVTDDIGEKDMRSQFEQYGEIKSVTLSAKTKCAFINFATHESAAAAYEKSYNNLTIKGHLLRVQWGRSKTSQTSSKPAAAAAGVGGGQQHFAASVGGDTISQGIAVDPDFLPPIPPPPGAGNITYAATNPHMLGSSSKTYRA